jgi:hypothetical protein
MHALAVDHMRARGNSYAQAYSHVYGAAENATLRNKVKAEHLAATLRGVAQDKPGEDDDGRAVAGPGSMGAASPAIPE